MGGNLPGYKLLITIVRRGAARKVVRATMAAGAGGGTTLLGRGTASHEATTIWGIPFEPEKEIILTVTGERKKECVLQAIVEAASLEKPGRGIAFAVDVSQAAGICHLERPAETGQKDEGRMAVAENGGIRYDLIVTIVNKGDAEIVVSASKANGAGGGTILSGRGTGIHEQIKLLGIPIEPEKEIVLTLIDQRRSGRVLDAIIHAAKLDKPGKGIVFVLAVEQIAGINHPAGGAQQR